VLDAQQATTGTAALTQFGKRFRRYRAVYRLDSARHVIAHSGSGPHPALLPARTTATE
jgi:hypothetical protein